MNALRSVVGVISVALAGSLVVGCGSSDGTSDGPVWTAATSQGLACQSDGIYSDGVRPEGCPIGKPPPPAPVIAPCPSGLTCSLVASTTLPAPVSGCDTPALFTEASSSGQITTEYLVSTCPTTTNGPEITAWIAANPTFNASETNTVPTLAVLSDGVYLKSMPPTPTSFPGSDEDAGSTSTTHEMLDPSGNALPCTVFYTVPPGSYLTYEAGYCVDTPSVETWAASPLNIPVVAGVSGGGVQSSIGDGFPNAPTGYVYVVEYSMYRHIGGMCPHGCAGS